VSISCWSSVDRTNNRWRPALWDPASPAAIRFIHTFSHEETGLFNPRQGREKHSGSRFETSTRCPLLRTAAETYLIDP